MLVGIARKQIYYVTRAGRAAAMNITSFEPQSAVAAIMYLASRASNDLYMVMKMLYVADKRHLNDTGRFMYGDNYVAMGEGSTPSGAYDLVKYVRGNNENHYGFPEAKEFFAVDGNSINLIADVPLDHLSEVALHYLDEVVEENERAQGHFRYWWKAAHDPSWFFTRESNTISNAPSISVTDIAEKSLENPELVAYLSE